MKQIVMFSGGASSAYTAKLVIDKYGKENTILLHTPTYAEHPTADTFRQQVAEYLGLAITVQEDGRDLWKLIEDNNCLPSFHIPFCTQQLKIKQTDIFLKKMAEEVNIHYGFGTDEYRRIQKVMARLEVKGYKTEFLVYESGIANEHIKRIIQDEWKIELPEPYKYLSHNNCIPCFKAGKSHFKQVCKYYPEEFERAVQMEHKIGHTVFKDCTLEDVREEVMKSKNQISFLDNDFNIPCECMD
jgi:hypothetical protein